MKKLIVALTLTALFVPLLSFAAYFNTGASPVVAPDQTIQQNAYLAGGTVTVAGPINGDLLAGGGTLLISSNVSQDIMALGGTITITNASAQDVRVAGGNVTIGADVSGEVVAAGGTLTITPDTTIVKDSYLAGGTLSFDGTEAGNLSLSGGTVYLNGTVDKDVMVTSGQKLVIGSSAVIKGSLKYSAPAEATIAPGAQILGATTFTQVMPKTQTHAGGVLGFALGILTILFLLKLILILTLTYLVWYIWKKDSIAVLEKIKSHYGMSLLWGFVFLVALPVAAFLTFITILGALAGIIALLIYGVLLILALPVAVLFTSSLLMKLRTDLRWYHILLGAVVLAIVRLIPFIGLLAALLVYLPALGALIGNVGSRFARRKK